MRFFAVSVGGYVLVGCALRLDRRVVNTRACSLAVGSLAPVVPLMVVAAGVDCFLVVPLQLDFEDVDKLVGLSARFVILVEHHTASFCIEGVIEDVPCSVYYVSALNDCYLVGMNLVTLVLNINLKL